MLALWSLVPLLFLNPAWTSGSPQFMYCWSFARRIFSITFLVCKMNAKLCSSLSILWHCFSLGLEWKLTFSSFLFIKFYFIFKLYNIVLVLPSIKMNPPKVYMCSPSWTLLHPPSPYHPSGSSQCTSPKYPVSCIKPGLAFKSGLKFRWLSGREFTCNAGDHVKLRRCKFHPWVGNIPWRRKWQLTPVFLPHGESHG